jgi:trk system potassium uptake protein TrkA
VHVVVVGCGRVGSGLAINLDDQGHSVAVVDRRSNAFRRLPAAFGGRTVTGVGFDRACLRDAGIEQASALAAVTSGDNSNILIARTGREYFGVERVVARIYDQRRAAIYERLGISTVATVGWAIDRVLRRIEVGTQEVEWIDPSARVCLVERLVPDSWAGHAFSALESDGGVRVVAVTRLGVAQVVSSALLAQAGDVVWLAVDGDRLEAIDALLAGGPGDREGGH